MDPQSLEQLIRETEMEAENRHHPYVTTEHLFYTLLSNKEIRKIFHQLGADVKKMTKQADKFLNSEIEPTLPKSGSRSPVQTLGFQRVMRRTLLHALSAGKEIPMPIDIIIAMFDEEDCYSVEIMQAQEISKLDLMKAASRQEEPDSIEISPILFSQADGRDVTDEWFQRNSDDDDEPSVSPQSQLQQILTNLNEQAAKGNIDPLIGREKEVQRCWQVLARRRKNNLLLVGESGVGKTALAEGLAWLIVNGKAPDILKDAVIYSLNVTSLIAGTKYRGEMEERLQVCVQFLQQQPGAILFIDEIQTIMGAGKTGDSAMDVSNLLKPALADGKLRCIGTTTYDDFRKSLSKDPGFQRRFLKVDIAEPSLEETLSILKGLQSHYEKFHRVKYTQEAISSAATLSQRYIQERKLPDKAIDVLDEAAAANNTLKPAERLEKIDSEQIEKVVSKIGNIPELRTSVSEREQLKNAEKLLKEQIFGQDKAIESTINLIKLSRAGLRAPQKPTASFLFAGPTGVGKTEIAKQLAKILNLNFIRFDMSEYQEKYAVSRLIGASPGYVGFENGGLLTEAIRKTPHCVLLLDEIEKAHPDIYDLLLQVMDAASLTDNSGRVADFQNAIIIMTSNAGGKDLSHKTIGFTGKVDVSQSMKAIENAFSPEFRNRLDEIIIFNPLQPDIMAMIVKKFIRQLQEQIQAKNVTLSLTNAAIEWLAKHGYDPLFGARPLDRLIQKHIKQPLAEAMLFGTLENGGSAHIDAENQDAKDLTLTFQNNI